MANPHRNEMLIKLGGEEILLRPTFESMAATEAAIGAMPYIAHRYGTGIKTLADGTIEMNPQSMPPLTDVARLFYLNQAEKKFTQEQIWGLVSEEGIRCLKYFYEFIVKCTAGNKITAEMSEAQKKS